MFVSLSVGSGACVFVAEVDGSLSTSAIRQKLKHLSLVGDTGYIDKEVNFAGSEALVGVKVVNIKPHVAPFVFPVVLSFSTSCTRCGHHRLCPRTSRFVSPVGHDVAS